MSRAREQQLTNVVFFPPVKKSEVAQITASFDAGLMILANVPAFYYGTSPNKFFDYLAAGIPVLNNYPGWLADLIEENRCGIVVRPNSPAEFAEALIRLTDSRDLRAEMRTNARRIAEGDFSRPQLSERFVGLIEMAAGESNTTRTQGPRLTTSCR